MPDKWEREIEDLLRDKFGGEEEPTPLRPPSRPRSRPQNRPPRSDFWRQVNALSAERLVVYGVVFALAAYLFRGFFGTATILLVLTSVSFIAGAVVVSVLKRESPYVEKRWRGQVINVTPPRRPASFTWYRLRAGLRRWLSRWR